MRDFVLAIVAIAYSLVCMTNDNNPSKRSASKSAKDYDKKGERRLSGTITNNDMRDREIVGITDPALNDLDD